MNRAQVLVTCLAVAVVSVICTAQCSYAASSGPNLLIDSQRIETIKHDLSAGIPVMMEAYRQLISDADGYLTKSPDPIKGQLKVPGFYRKEKEHMAIKDKIKPDSKAAFSLALAYAISGEKKYGLKSKEFIFAWVNNLGKPVDGGDLFDILTFDGRGDTGLMITYTFPNFIYAYDILDSLGMISEDESSRFDKWLRVYVDYCDEECLIKNNHHNWQSLFLMSAGHVLQDHALFEKGVSYFKNGFKTQVMKDGAMPLELMRNEKCASYTLMALEAMLQGAYIASKNGHPEILDIRSRDGGGLKQAVDCLATFLDDPDNWQKKRRKSYPGYKKPNRPADKSDWGWIFELPYSMWKSDRYLAYMQKRPYGEADRTYTLIYSTLLFLK